MNPSASAMARVVLERTGAVIFLAELADTPSSRRRGLLGRAGLEPDHGMLIRPCSSVHTWFMRFPIDVVFLDRDGIVLRIVARMGPWRLARGKNGAWQTLELAAGAGAAAGLRCGDRLILDEAPTSPR
jgi:uncharacterized protein